MRPQDGEGGARHSGQHGEATEVRPALEEVTRRPDRQRVGGCSPAPGAGV